MLWHGPQRLDRRCIVLKFSTGDEEFNGWRGRRRRAGAAD
jgi:hypothetical protein